MENRIGDARRDYADRIGGFTQKDAAEYFGVSLSTYKKWEQGQGKLNGGILREISDKYGVSVDYLLGLHPKAVVAERQPSREERELVDLYRAMGERERVLLMENARAFAALSVKDGAGNTEDVERAGIVMS